ncbi:MAG TPA: ABC transporter ATP-binding protein [Anaerolineae bacterium]|nr:ABC transporter ATP-binding protein [Anaerolineae bacterium]
MTDTLVNVENVSKKFCRNLKRSLWYGVKDVGTEMIGRGSERTELRAQEFWAVKDVSFQLKRGETLGLIGHNGAGKTTMLRMLNGLIKPDTGRIVVRGRIQALIALGAGFNPVLTGRENIYVNASVLGIPKAEIDRRFDQIVDFSGIEEFIDTPVQSYSSGMTVRLGFSIAAHLEPDILLVDEVLAVGDLAFKTKCQVRIQELRDTGVAIILVSHNLHTISHVCSRAITFEKGRVLYDGDTERAIDVYRNSLIKANKGLEDSLRAGTGEIKIKGLEILDEYDDVQEECGVGDYVKLRVHYETQEPVVNPVFNVTMHVLNSHQVTGIRTDVDGVELGRLEGTGHVDIVIPDLNLLPNIYTMDAVIFHSDGFTFYDRVNKAAHLRVTGGLQVNGTAYLPHVWANGEGSNGRVSPITSPQPELAQIETVK